MSEKVRVVRKKPEEIFSVIGWLMDRSGSMSSLREAAVGGYSQFIEEQKALPGEAVFTLAQFDHSFELLQNNVPIQEAFEYTANNFIPRGNTRLRDAIGRIMATMSEAILQMDRKTDVVLLGIMTDGEENDSREFTDEMIKSQIAEWETHGWKVIFLSSEPKAVDDAVKKYGMNKSQVSVFAGTPRGMKAGFSGVSGYATQMRSGFVPSDLKTEDEE